MADIAQVEVVALVERFQKDMASAGQAFGQIVRQMAAAQAPVQVAAQETGKAQDGLLGKLRDFRSEQVQQGRMARFYAGEVMSLIPAADGAKGSLQSLAAILAEGAAGGLGFGLAFEGAKLLAGAIKEAGAQANLHKDAIRAISEDAAKILGGMRPKGLASEEFVAQGAQSKEMRALLEQETRAQEDLRRAEAGTAQDRILADAAGLSVAEYRAARIEGEKKKLAEIRDKIAEVTAELGKQYNEIRSQEKTNEAVAREAAGREATARARKQGGDDAGASKAQEAEEARAADRARAGFERLAAESAAIRKKWAMATATELERVELDLAADLERIDKLDEETRLEIVRQAEERKRQIRQKAAQQAALQGGAEARRARVIQEAEVRALAAAAAQPFENLAQGIASSVGHGFAEIMVGAKGLEEGFNGIFEGILKSFEQMIAQMIEKLIVSGLLSLLGSIIGGPVGGFLGQQAGNIASFDVGTWRVPRDIVAQIHEGEIITPAPMADAIRSGQATLGAGGGSSRGDTYVIHAMDARSFEDFLHRNRGSLVKTMGSLQRDHRL